MLLIDENDPAILRIGRFVVTRNHWRLLTVRDNTYTVRGDTVRYEQFGNRLCPVFTQGQVVLPRATRVGMSHQGDPKFRSGLHIIGMRLYDRDFFLGHPRTIEIEIDRSPGGEARCFDAVYRGIEQ